MANPALFPNITLPFILPPVNFSTIYQGEEDHYSNAMGLMSLDTNFFEKGQQPLIYKTFHATFKIILSR